MPQASRPRRPVHVVAAVRSPVAVPRILAVHNAPEAVPAHEADVLPVAAPAVAVAPTRPSGLVSGAGKTRMHARLTPPSFAAAYLDNPPPSYPLAARRKGDEGTVTLRVLVTQDGVPGNVVIDRSSGSTALDAAALAAVRAWRFVPAREAGRAVDAWVLVPIVFRLQDAS